MSREPGTTTRERVEQIKTYVRDHIDERLDLEDIARQFYISSHYLSHYFRRETGFTLGQFIAQAKIDRAKELLQKGFSVTDTAISLSYNSDSHFINTFKRLTGTTPKRYASQNLRNTRLNWEKLVNPQAAEMSVIFSRVLINAYWALRMRVIWM